jgi:DNA polymerase-1
VVEELGFVFKALAKEEQKSKKAMQRVKQIKTKKEETLDEAFDRIRSLKLREEELTIVNSVERMLQSGTLTRESSKKLSKKEVFELYKLYEDIQRKERLASMVKEKPANYYLVSTQESLHFSKAKLQGAKVLAIDCETFGEKGAALDPFRGEMAGFSISTDKDEHFYIPLQHLEQTDSTWPTLVFSELKDVLEEKQIVMHNAPFDCKWFFIKYGINLVDKLLFDTRIGAMSLDENASHRLKDLATLWLDIPSSNFDELFDVAKFHEVPIDVACVYACKDTSLTMKLFNFINHWYEKRSDLTDIRKLVYDIEMPVCREFIRSDLRGIRFNTQAAIDLDTKLEAEEKQLEQQIYELLGEEININSPAQLSKKLFNELNLPNPDKGSTGVKVLKKIKKEHPVIEKILSIRELSKLRQAFTQKLPGEVKSDNHIHPWHNTWGAATGRFTCSSPNTQQIPAKRPEIRHLFLPSGSDRIFISIDFSQIELRVLAHYANDPILINAFVTGKDLHSTTAAQIYLSHLPFEEAYKQIEEKKDIDGSQEQKWRKASKTINFGIVYGMSPKGLAEQLQISEKEAKEIIDGYFRAYPGIKKFMDEQVKKARMDHYVTDLFGRKRRLHNEYKSGDRYDALSGDRMAGNFSIQSSAGTLLKKAIVDLQQVLPELDSFISLQIHDELLFDCPKGITREEVLRIRDTMQNAVKLNVPIKSDVEINPHRWAEKVDFEEWFNG